MTPILAAAGSDSLLTVAYLGAGILFILSLGGLSSQESARRGNLYGILGMLIALGATLLHPTVQASLVQNGSAVLLRLPNGIGWRLIAEGGTVSLAESIYLGETEDVRRSEQIVVSGALEAGTSAARVKWALKRVPKKI